MSKNRRLRKLQNLLTFDSLEARRLLATESTASFWPNVLTTDTSPTAAIPQTMSTTSYSLRELVEYYDNTYNSDSQPMTIQLSNTKYVLTETSDASSVEGARNNNSNQYGALDILATHTTQPLIIEGTSGTILTCDFVSGTSIPLDRLLHVISGSLDVEGVTLEGGEAKDNSTGQYTNALGGGVLVNPGGTLSLTNCAVLSNKAVASTNAISGQVTGISAAGGGVYGSAGSVINIVGSTTFTNNQVIAGNGGSTGPNGLNGGVAYGGGLAIGANVNEPSATGTPTSTTLSLTAQSGSNASFDNNHLNVTTHGLATGGTGGAGSHAGGAGGNAYGGGLYVGTGTVAYPTALKINGGNSATPINFTGNEIAGGLGDEEDQTATRGIGGAAFGAGAYVEPASLALTNGPTSDGIMTFSNNTELSYTGYTSVTSGMTTTYTPSTITITSGLEVPPISPSTASNAATTPWSLMNAVAVVNPLVATGMTIQLSMGPAASDGGFETPALSAGTYESYSGETEGPWAFSGTAGISSNDSSLTSQNPNAPQGTQVAFLQDTGAITQGITGFIAGDSYSVSFEAAQRDGYPSSSINVTVDGISIGTYTPNGTTYQTITTSTFVAASGYNAIAFTGVDPNSANQTVFIDNVQMVQNASLTYSGGVAISSTGSGNLVIIGTGVSSTLVSGAGLSTSVFSISPNANVSFSNLTIEDGTAAFGGGINASNAAVTLSNVSVVKNTSSSHGGGLYQLGGMLALTNNTKIVGNSSVDGGGISLNSVTFTMHTGQVRNNNANGQGGGLSAYGNCLVTFSNAAISSNHVTGSAAGNPYFQGGGLYQYSGGTLNLLNSTVKNNSSTLEGGGVFVADCDMNIVGSTIQGNQAGSANQQSSEPVQGGGIYILQQPTEAAKLTNVTVSKNGPAGSNVLQGGGMYDEGGNLSVKGTNILGNSAMEGGGIDLFMCSFTMNGGQLINNVAANYGGALYVDGEPSTPISLSNVTVSNNSTDNGQGGGIEGTDVVLTLTSCTVSDNTAAGDAGAVFVNGSSKLTINGGSITGNKGYNGGAILAKTINGANLSVQISGASISSNTASLSGGGIFQLTGSLKITNATLKSNTAVYDGGGVYASGVANYLTSAVIKSNTLSGNGATGGGGLYLTGGSLNSKGLTVVNNTITSPNSGTIEGGGIDANNTTISLDGANSTSVSLGASYNRIGISYDGVSFSGGGADGGGNVYSSNLLGSALAGVGAFNLGTPDQNDVVSCQGQTISAPDGTYSAVNLAAAGVDGAQVNQTFTLRFSDNTSQTVSQSFSDWCDPQHYAGESILSSMAYRDTSSGGRNSAAPYVYGYSFAIPAGKVLVSVTLPNASDLLVLAMNLSDVAAGTTISGNTLTASGGGSVYGAGLYLNQSTLTTAGLVEVEDNGSTSTGQTAQSQGGGIYDVSGSSTFGGTLTVSGNSLSGQSGGNAGGAGIQAVNASITIDNGVPWGLDGNTISGVQDATGAGIDFATGCSFSYTMPNLWGNTATSPVSTSGGGSGPVGANLAFTVPDVVDDNSGVTRVSGYTNSSGSLRDAVNWAQSSLLPTWNSVDIQLSDAGSNYILGTGQPLTIGIGSGESLVIVGPSNDADIQGWFNHTIVDNGGGDLAFENIVINGGYANSDNGSQGGGVVLSGSGSLTLVNGSVEHNYVVGSHGYHSPTVNTWNNNHTRNSTNGGSGSGGGIYQASGNLYLVGNSVVKSNTAFGGTGGTGTNGNGVAGRTGKMGGDAFGGGIFQTGGTLYLGQNARIESNLTIGGNGGTGGSSNSKQGGSGGLAGTAWAGGVDSEQGATIDFANGYQNSIMQDNIATNGNVGALGKGDGNYAQTSDPSAGNVMNPSNFYHSGQVVSSYQSAVNGIDAVVGQGLGMPQSGGTLSLGVGPLSASSGNPALGGAPHGESMPGVTVELFNAQGGLVATAISGSDGHFDFRTQFTGMGYCEVVPLPSYEIAPTGTVTDANIPSAFDAVSGRTALLQFYQGVALNQSLHLVMRQIDSALQTGTNYIQLVNKENNTVIWRDQLAPRGYKGGFTFAAVDLKGGISGYVVLPRSGAASPMLVNRRTGAITFVQGQVSGNLQRGFSVIAQNLVGNDGVPDLLLTPTGGNSGYMSVIDPASDVVAWTSRKAFGGRRTVGFDTFEADSYDSNVVLTSLKFDARHLGYSQKVLSGQTGKLIASGFTPNPSATPINLGPFAGDPSIAVRVGQSVPDVARPRRRARPR